MSMINKEISDFRTYGLYLALSLTGLGYKI